MGRMRLLNIFSRGTLMYKLFIRPVVSYSSPVWFPFLCGALKKYLEMCHKSACRVESGCLASAPVLLLLLESLAPPLEITLNHQALAFFELALRLPADNFPLQRLAVA